MGFESLGLVDLLRQTDDAASLSMLAEAVVAESGSPWRETESGLIVPDKAQMVATIVTIYTALIVAGLFLREVVRLDERITEGNRVAMFFALLSWAQLVVVAHEGRWDRATVRASG